MAHFKTSLLRISAFTALLLGAGVSANSAQAGFQWSPSAKTPSAPALVKEGALPDAGPVMPAIPQGKVESADLTKMPTAPQEEPLDPLSASMDDMNSAQTPAIAAAAPQAPTVPKTGTSVKKESGSTYADAVGFGSDMPLALAMRQIVPAQYAFVFDPAVNQGAKVTWNGGKPWDIVLNDALKPLGYSVSVDDNIVHVGTGEKSAAAVPAPAAMPVMAKSTPDQAAPAARPVREVYVRRNTAGPDVEERMPGSPEAVAAVAKPAVTGAAKTPDAEQKPGFWSHVNPANWGSSKESADDSARVETVNTSAARNQTASAGEAPVPEGPDAKPDVFQTPVTLTGASAPSAEIDPAKQPTLNATDAHSWQADKGSSLKDVLKKWSEAANVQLYWVPAQDYKINVPISLEGSYTDAVSSVLASYGDKGPRPVGRLHPNMPNGPAVLIIEPSSS